MRAKYKIKQETINIKPESWHKQMYANYLKCVMCLF